MIALVLAAAFFVGIHVFISGTRLRNTLVARLGAQGFMGFFSVLSVAGITWMGWVYSSFPM